MMLDVGCLIFDEIYPWQGAFFSSKNVLPFLDFLILVNGPIIVWMPEGPSILNDSYVITVPSSAASKAFKNSAV